MYSYISQGEDIAYNLIQLCADTREDIDDLPTNVAVGSTCIIIEDSSVWMLNNKRKWEEL